MGGGPESCTNCCCEIAINIRFSLQYYVILYVLEFQLNFFLRKSEALPLLGILNTFIGLELVKKSKIQKEMEKHFKSFIKKGPINTIKSYSL